MFRRTGVQLLSVAILPLGIGLALQDSPESVMPAADRVQAAADGPVSYSRQVAPIFEARCSECHGTDTRQPEADLVLLTYESLMKGSEYGTVIEAGDPENSLLLEMVTSGEMPQDADPVPAEEIELIRAWIAAGAENN